MTAGTGQHDKDWKTYIFEKIPGCHENVVKMKVFVIIFAKTFGKQHFSREIRFWRISS
jgi:hypothetical protein